MRSETAEVTASAGPNMVDAKPSSPIKSAIAVVSVRQALRSCPTRAISSPKERDSSA
jgi:ferredoxin